MATDYRFHQRVRYSDLVIGLAKHGIREAEVTRSEVPSDGCTHTLVGQRDRVVVQVETGWVKAIRSLGSGTILGFVEREFGTITVNEAGYWNGPISVIFDIYHSLPEELRSVPCVTQRLKESGREMLPERVRDHLEKVLISELSEQDVLVTARTLRILADLGDSYYSGGAVALQEGKHFVKPLLDTIDWPALHTLAWATGRLLGAYESNEALDDQLAAIDEKQRWKQALAQEENSEFELAKETVPDLRGGQDRHRSSPPPIVEL